MRMATKYLLTRLGILEPAQQFVSTRRLHKVARKIDLRDIQAPGERLARCIRFESLSQYKFEHEKNSALRKARRSLESSLAASDGPTLLRGRDPITGTPEWYCLDPRHARRDKSGQLNLREMLTCERHGFPSRLRATLVSLYSLIPEADLAFKSIYISERTPTLSPYFQSRFPQVSSPQVLDGPRHDDLTALEHSSETLDVVISLEVLGHVPDYRPALHEMWRVLRPGGLALITAPFNSLGVAHVEFARQETTGGVTYLAPPDHHPNPIELGDDSICYRHFGWRLLEELKESGFREVSILESWDLDAAILGEGLNVICARK